MYTLVKSLVFICFTITCAQAQYGVRMRWTSNAQSCTNPPDAVEYWPLGSPFAEQGSGTCVDVPLADGGHAYYTYTTAASSPSVPSSWSPFYAIETFYENSSACAAAEPDTVASVVLTNSDSCIFMGASSTGYYYQRLDCTSESSGQVLSCKDSACTDCRAPSTYQGGCDDFVNSVHSCAANTPSTPVSNPAPTPSSYGVRKMWTSNSHNCQDEPASIDYWPANSPFADQGQGSCVQAILGGGGKVYYSYSTSHTAPKAPKKWSPFYAVETYYYNESLCDAADPSTVDLVTITNSNSCIYMGASTIGYSYMQLKCTSETAGQVYSCKDASCKQCMAPFQYQGGCDDFVNSVHSCATH